MFKRYLSMILAVLLVSSANSSVIFAQTKTDDNDSNTAKVKAEVLKRGTNEKKRVRVKMLNGTKLKGYISQIGDDSFTLTVSKTKQPTVIAYRDTKRVESGGLSGGARIGIIIGAAVIGTAVVLALAFRHALRVRL